MKWGLFIAMLLFSQVIVAKEPELTCEKIWGEMTWEGMEFHRYKLRAENFPPQKKFLLIVRSFDGTETETFTYNSNKKGHLILEPVENTPQDIYAICPAKRGERLTFVMKSDELAFSADVVPFPLEMKSKKGVKLNLELQGDKGEKFFLTGDGFKANETVELACKIDEQTLPFEAFITPLGELIAYITLPDEQEGGKAKLILKRKKKK